MIAGREITLLVRPADKRYFVSRLAGGIVVVLVALAFYNYTVRVHERHVRQTTAIRKFAKKVEKELGQDFPFVHIDARFALQFYLNTFHRHISYDEAEELIESDEPVFLALKPSIRQEKLLSGDHRYIVAQCPDTESPFLVIVSNHPRLERVKGLPPAGVSGAAAAPEKK